MGRIIVIEDNTIFADYVCRLLATKGFQSISTFNCNGCGNKAGTIPTSS